MLDTVRVGFAELELDPKKLMRHGWTRAQYERSGAEDVPQLEECFTLRRKDEHPHYLGWWPRSGRFKVETSFPKMLYGTNVSMVRAEDVMRGIDHLSEVVSDCTGKEIDMRESEIQGRVDFVFAYDTIWGDRGHVGEYLDAFKSLELPRHYSENIAKESTLYWRNKVRVIRLYDKFKESQEDEAKDTLRFEVQLNHAKAEFESLIPGLSMRLTDVARWDVAKQVLGNYLTAMGADLVVSNERELAERLVRELGPARARRLMGYVVFLRLWGHAGMNELGFDRKMPWRDRKELESVGLSGAVNDRGGTSGLLPPLGLPENYSGEPMKLRG